MIQFFKQYQPINFFIVIFIAVLLWLKIFFNNDIQGIIQFDNQSHIYGYIYSLLYSNNLLIFSKIIAFLLIITQASIISGINNQFNLLGFRSYLPGLIYILFISNFNEFKVLHPIHFANLLFILAWFELKKSKKSFSSSNYFNAAFLIGLSSLFYFNFIYLVFIIIAYSFINKQISIRKILIILIGFFTVWYLYLSILFIINGNLQDFSWLFDFKFSFNNFKELNLNNSILLVYSAILILLSSIDLQKYYFKLKNSSRNNLLFLFQLSIFSLLFIIFTGSGFEIVYILAIPIALFLSLFFTNLKNKWISEGLFFVFILIVMINNIYPKLFFFFK